MTPREKLLSAVLLFSAWAAMVAAGVAPAADFASALRDALLALGVFQATVTRPGDPP